MIRPFHGKPDWFVADIDDVRPIFGASGVIIQGQKCRIHRTHLPLLHTDEAERLLVTVNNKHDEWAARDAYTKPLGFTLRTTQQQAIDFIKARRGTLLGDDMRCIDGETIVYCSQGESKFKVSLSELYQRFNGRYSSSPISVFSLCDKRFKFNEIVAVHFNGQMDVVRITTHDGKVLRLTGDHEVALANGGWKRADALKTFERIISSVNYDKLTKVDVVMSVVPDGEANVFDVVCKDPYRNFVANGIVVHNCGKTLSGLMAHDPASGPLVVIAPLPARGVWLGWMRRAFPEYADNIGIALGRKFNPDVLKHPLIFMHYDVIKDWQAPLEIGTLIFDEAHFLTNHQSKRSNAAVFHALRAKRVIAMTGTPIWNMPSDLWNVLGLAAPGGFGGYHDFCRRYGLPVQSAYGVKYTGISNEIELRERMAQLMLRRRWIDISDDIPAITRNVLVATIDDPTRRKLDIIAAKLKNERTNTVGNLSHYRSQLSLFKVPTIVNEVNRVLDAGEPIVVWTWHKQLADKLKESLGLRAYLIHGDIHVDKRDEQIALWKQSTKSSAPTALIATMAVAQVAVDFSEARLALFGEIDYTPAVLAQAEMRTFSPLRGMNITFVVADHIIDQRIIRALISKLGAANPLGVGAAVDAIDALRTAVFGVQEEADLSRLLDDLLNE